MHKETEIFKKLNKLKYDSTTPNFIKIESLVISIMQADQILEYCKYAYMLDSPIVKIMHKLGKEQAAINGIGLLQLLYYEQNCIRKLYKLFTNNNLELPDDIKKIRNIRNLIIGHPDERGFIPNFGFNGCDAYPFAEAKNSKENKNIYYEEIIIRQQKFISNVLDELIMLTNK